MNLGLQGKGILITGGSRGIGRAIALTSAAEGANVAICGRRQEDIHQTLHELREYNVRVFGQVADVTHQEEMEQFLAASVDALGAIDSVVNNVGGSKGKGLLASTDEEWMTTFDLNLFQTVRVTRAAVPYIQQRGGGSIVIISSISGYKPSPSVQYGSAKAAEIFLSQALALELAPFHIRVNTVCPGSTFFPGGGWERTQHRHPEQFEQFQTEEFPLGRLGMPEEIARVVVFVASPAASWINGAMVPVDGGQQQPAMFQKGPMWR
jgi:3-oxoacyl-[acyl-carrier protein] reductase